MASAPHLSDPLRKFSVCGLDSYIARSTLTQFTEMGKFVHACEGEMFCESNNPKIPYFNAPIYLENKASRYLPDKANSLEQS